MLGASQETAMSQLTSLLAFLLTASAAWATTTPQGQGVPAGTGRGLADYWWIILVVIVVAAAIWYFMRRNKSSV